MEPSVLTANPAYLNTLDEEQRQKVLRLLFMFLLYLRKHPIETTDGTNQDQRGDYPTSDNNLDAGVDLVEIGKELESKIDDLLTANNDLNTIIQHPYFIILFETMATDDLDYTLSRFLKARKWRLPDAFAMLLRSCDWRQSYGVHELMLQGESRFTESLMASGKGFIWEEDQEGRVCCYARAKLHNKNTSPLKESSDFLVFWLETGRILRRHDQQLVTLVLDMGGASMSSFDLPFAKFIFSCLQSYYPEILGQALILDAPWLFWGFWKMLSPLIDPVVAAKIKFIQSTELKNYIAEEKIPIEFGGTSTFSWSESYISHKPDGEDGLLKDETINFQTNTNLESLYSEFFEISKSAYRDQFADADDNERRNFLKASLRKEHYRIFQAKYPKCIYHYIGIFDEKGHVTWQPSRNSTFTHGRCSAPPTMVDGKIEISRINGTPFSTND